MSFAEQFGYGEKTNSNGLEHKRIWIIIISGSLLLFAYYYSQYIGSPGAMQMTAAEMVIKIPLIILGVYIGAFIKLTIKKTLL